MCWGDVGLLLSMPRQGLGNSAIASVANDEQLERFEGVWAGMAITEPGTGSDSANIKTTAVLDGDEYVINGEKIYVTSGDRADHIVVWATLDRDLGRAAIKSFVVAKGTPGMRVDRLEHKLGIRASDTATIIFDELPGAEGEPPRLAGDRHQAGLRRRDGDLRQHPPAGRRDGGRLRDRARSTSPASCWPRPASWSTTTARRTSSRPRPRSSSRWRPTGRRAHLLMLQAAWMADNRKPNSLEASMAKAKAGRVGSDITLSCVELCGTVGYSESELLEKWARDSKILDIFEGTQQIQQLIVARRVLGLSSAELK